MDNHDLRNPTPTEREREVLRLAADGLTEAEMARRLGVKRTTLCEYKRRAFYRLEAVSTTHAVALAIRRGIIE